MAQFTTSFLLSTILFCTNDVGSSENQYLDDVTFPSLANELAKMWITNVKGK